MTDIAYIEIFFVVYYVVLIEICFEVLVIHCLEGQTKTYFVYPSLLELAAKRFCIYIYIYIKKLLRHSDKSFQVCNALLQLYL